MGKKIRVIQYGLGAMGLGMVSMMLEKEDLEVVAAISASGRNVGLDLGEVLGLDRKVGLTISGQAEEVFKSVEADVVMHATCSTLDVVLEQVAPALKTGKNVITIAEEAVYPVQNNIEIAKQLDELAKANNVSIVGTGINPGFMFDFLPISITGVMRNVSKVRTRRVVNFAKYGLSVWEHIGVGKDLADFEKGVKDGNIVLHVGLHETVALTAKGLNWELTNYNETKEPLISKSKRKTEFGEILPGQTCGFRQVGTGWRNDDIVVVQEIVGIINPNKDEDGLEVGTEIWVEGFPSSYISIGDDIAEQGGVGTFAHAVNTIPQIIESKPGYVTVLDLPPAACLK